MKLLGRDVDIDSHHLWSALAPHPKRSLFEGKADDRFAVTLPAELLIDLLSGDVDRARAALAERLREAATMSRGGNDIVGGYSDDEIRESHARRFEEAARRLEARSSVHGPRCPVCFGLLDAPDDALKGDECSCPDEYGD